MARCGARARAHFETLQAQADALADALIGDAARVAEAEAEREAGAVAQTAADEAEAGLQALAEEKRGLAAAWTHLGGERRRARRARRHGALARRGPTICSARAKPNSAEQAKRDILRAKLKVHRPGLERLAAEAGLPPLALDAGQTARRISARLKELARAGEEARALAAQIETAPARIAALRERLDALGEEERDWREAYAAMLSALRLEVDASFETARARIDLWRALPGEWEDHARDDRQVSSINRDHAAFEAMVAGLIAQCAPELAALPPLDATRALQRRLADERGKATTRANAEARLAKMQAAATQAEEMVTRAEAALNAFAADASFSGDLSLLGERLRDRRAHQDRIDAQAERLALVAEGADEAQLAGKARDFDAEAARARLEAIAREMEARRLQAQEVFSSRSAARSQLARYDESVGAEKAVIAREAARTDIAGESRRWATLKLAALLAAPASKGTGKRGRTRCWPAPGASSPN